MALLNRSSLLCLSDELIALIAQELAEERSNLTNFALTCHRLSNVSQFFLLHSVVVRKGPDLKTFTDLVLCRADRRRYVQRLTIVPTTQENAVNWHRLTAEMACLRHLRRVHVETPFRYAVNDDETQDSWTLWSTQFLALFESRFFPLLEWCKLNFQDVSGRTWKTFNLTELLKLPRLQHLELVSLDFEQCRSQRSFGPQRSSNLKSLVLDMCRVTAASLDGLLSAPTQLQTFTWIERYRDINVDEAVDHFQHMIACLAKHKRSLRGLALKFLGSKAFIALVRRGKMNFTSLTGLKRLELWLSDFCFEMIHDSPQKCFEFPCSLQTLKLCASKNDGHAFAVKTVIQQQLKRKDPRSALRLIELSWSPSQTVDIDPVVPSNPVVPAMQIEISRLGAQLKAERNIQLRAYRRTRPRCAQPPYLYGEYVPEELLVYDSFCPQWRWDVRAQVEIDDQHAAQKQAQQDEQIKAQQATFDMLHGPNETPQDLLLNQINSNNI